MAFREARESELFYILDYQDNSETLTATDLSADSTFTQDNMYRYTEFLTQANGINLRTHSYETSGANRRMDWGLRGFPNQYDNIYPQE